MAVSAKANQITGAATTGTQGITDPGFTPKVLMILLGLQTAAGAAVNAQFNLGVATSTSDEQFAGYNSVDAAPTSDVVRVLNSGDLLRLFAAGTTTTDLRASLNSMDASGFTFNWGAMTTTSPKVNYLAIGGADITNAIAGTFASNTSTGNQSVTGLGFQPDIVFLFATLQTVGGVANNNSQYGFGVMTASAQWACTVKGQNSQATMNNSRAFSNARCLILPNTTTNTLFQEMSFVSMDSGGFTVNIDTAGGSAILIGYLAIKGGQWKVGTETQKTSTGTKSTTGVGFTPKGLILASVCDTQTSGTADSSRLCVGFSTGASNNVSLWTGDTDNVADAIADTIMSDSKCIVMATEGTPTTNAEANIDSLDGDGFTLNWTTADATARVFGYVAFGDNAGAPTTAVKDIIGNGVVPFAR